MQCSGVGWAALAGIISCPITYSPLPYLQLVFVCVSLAYPLPLPLSPSPPVYSLNIIHQQYLSVHPPSLSPSYYVCPLHSNPTPKFSTLRKSSHPSCIVKMTLIASIFYSVFPHSGFVWPNLASYVSLNFCVMHGNIIVLQTRPLYCLCLLGD